MRLSFTVYGHPEPQGSTRPFVPKGWSRAITTSANKNLKPWRQDVSQQAMAAMVGQQLTRDAVEVEIKFYFAKPKSTPKRVQHKTTKPDADKIARSVLDSLTGVVFADDSQVVKLSAWKGFGTPERAEILVVTAEELAA